MATINSKKLLPGSEKKEVFLVPTKNIVPSAPKLEGVKPSEKKASKTPLLLEGKVIEVTELFNNNLLLKAADKERKRKEEERKEFDEREKKLEEKKLGKKGQQGSIVSKIPGSSLFDRLARFTGFTLLGFIFNNYSNLLPKLNALGAILKPVAVGFGYFAEGILSGTIDWIEKGYKAYDTVRDWTKQLGGENFQKLFDDFSGALNVFLNTAVIAGLAGIKGGALQPKSGYTPGGVAAGLGRGDRQKLLDKAILRAKSREEIRLAADRRKSAAMDKLQARKDARLRQIASAENFRLGEKKRKRAILPEKERVLAPYKQREVGTKTKKSLTEFLFGDEKFGYEKKQPSRSRPQTYSFNPDKVKYSSNFPSGYVDFTLKGSKKRVSLSIAKYLESILAAEGVNSKIAEEIFKNPKSYEGSARRFMGMGYDFEARMITRRKKPKVGGPRIEKPKVGAFGRIKKGLEKFGKRGGTKIKPKVGAVGALKAVGLKGFAKRIPIVGPIIDFVISLLSGDPLGEAGAAAVGSAVGAALGTFIPIPFVGTIAGGILGDLVGRGLYNVVKYFTGFKDRNIYGKTFSQGGIVDPKRKIKVVKKQEQRSDSKEPSPVELRPLFSDAKLKFLYGSESSIKLIKSISGNLAGVGGFIGSLMSASINLLFGQKFDGALLKYIGLKYGKSAENLTRIASDSIVRMVQNQLAYGERTDKTGKKQGFLSWAAGLLGLDGSSDDAPPIQKPPGQKPTQGSLSSVLPKGNPKYTSEFGSRWGRQHKGIDIGVDAGSPVTALDEGKVIDIYPNFGGHGVGIVVQHSDGTKIVYGHVNSNVNIGDIVKKGQTIATVKGWYNAYGNPDNTHLHLERYVDGSAVDPSGYLNSIEKIKLDKVSSLQKQNPELLAQTPVYAKNQEFTYVVQPVIMA